MNNNKGKSRERPHSASSSKQQQQKSSKTNAMDEKKPSASFLPSFRTKSNGGFTGISNVTSIVGRVRNGASGKSALSSLLNPTGGNSMFSDILNSRLSSKPTGDGNSLRASISNDAPTMGSTAIAQPFTLKGGPPALTAAIGTTATTQPTPTKVDNAISSTGLKSAAAAVGGTVVTTIATGKSSQAIGDNNINSTSSVTHLLVASTSCSMFLLDEPPTPGMPLSVIAATDSMSHGKIIFKNLLQTRQISIGSSELGKKVPLLSHTNSQGLPVKCVFVIPQKVTEAETIRFQGQLHTIPPNLAAICVDNRILPFQFDKNKHRERAREWRTKSVTLTAKDGGQLLATVPYMNMASLVLKTKRKNVKMGSTVRGVSGTVKNVYVGAYNEDIHGPLGITTELGRQVLPRPLLVMPLDAMPLGENVGNFNFTLANLERCSVEYRVSLVSEYIYITEEVEEKIAKFLLG